MPCHFGYVFTETGGGVVPPPRQRPKGQASPTRALPRLSWKTWLNSAPPDSPGLHPQSRAGSRKEVFQPHLPVRLPCYDLAPVTSFTLGRPSRLRTSGTPGSHGLTGGVYKARERIHRAMADARLLANPASRSRVADSDPNWDGVSGSATARTAAPLCAPPL